MILPTRPTTLAIVDWIDAAYLEDLPPLLDPTPFATVAVGFLLSETEEAVSLAMEWFEDGTLRRILTIPRGMVQDIRYLDLDADDGDERHTR